VEENATAHTIVDTKRSLSCEEIRERPSPWIANCYSACSWAHTEPGDYRAVARSWIHPHHRREQRDYHDQVTISLDRNRPRNFKEWSTASIGIGHNRAVTRLWIHSYQRMEICVYYHYTLISLHSNTFRDCKALTPAHVRP